MKTKTIKSKSFKIIMIATLVTCGSLLANLGHAQNGTTSKEKMAPLTHWDGIWEGEGWSFDQNRQRIEFTVRENIQVKLDGRTILAEGIGKNKGSGMEGFHALGVFYYNNERQTYEVKSWLDDGNMTLATAEINDKGQFVWGFDVQGGRVQYTITLTETSWNEKGEFVMAGGQAFPIMEMNLTKIK